MKRIVILFGIAGSGKSTLALTLSQLYNYHYVSPSDVLHRIAEACDCIESSIVRESLSSGTLIPDSLFNRLIANHLNQRKTDKVVFDGYPRTRSTATEFENLILSNGFSTEDIYIIHVLATEEEALQRYLQRNRIGDHNSKRWHERLKWFQENELPLIIEYSRSFHHLNVNASDSLQENIKYVLDYLGEIE
jgi:adenylate kinase family enzyme